MLGRSRTDSLKKDAARGGGFAAALAKDRKFRKELLKAARHGRTAKRRADRRIGFFATSRRLATDERLRRDVQEMMQHLQNAWSRVEKKRSHRLRNTFLIVGVGGVVAAVPQVRRFVIERFSVLPVGGGTMPRTIEESIEVNVPVATAYNQWTQFEDFPLFMEGVDHVQQLDDTRLRWAATIAGRTHEWDAKILEQHPDRQVSWISEDGKKTRGAVTFEPRGDNRTLIHLSMSYEAEGPVEALGSAAGLDARRVRGDLERFKELIESRGVESGGWRGEVSAGEKKS